MEYNIKAKPTYYKGNKYRSKLEARWACFFDLIGWQYEYEPCEFNGWTPDFIVYGSGGRVIYFEVKPYIEHSIIVDYMIRLDKLQLKANVILLSNEFKESYGYTEAGIQLNSFWKWDQEYAWCVSPISVHWKCGQRGRNTEYDIGSGEMAYDGLLWNDIENRKVFIWDERDVEYRILYNKWVDAGNKISYKYGRLG